MRGQKDARGFLPSKGNEISQGYNSFFPPFTISPVRDDFGDMFTWPNGRRGSDALSNLMRRRIADTAISILIAVFG